ncbi:ComEC/Rec2 family competence protein [Patulibacter americanus]|uniref:ComEC/Rec2 family competence protein n=1 Tax=Patulibacter americanus TaxID=588672 RepID=UPI0003B3CF3C|nr:ComEC/Rec2 family competence protein [Patulibacter americanus]
MSARWPQHHVALIAAVGLVVGPRWPVAVVVLCALAWATQPRPGWASVAVAVALLASVGGAWRAAQAQETARVPLASGPAVGPDEPVEVLEPAERALDGRWRTTVRLRGATVELRTPVAAAAPALVTGRLVRVRGSVRPVAEGAVGARARGIALTLDAVVVGDAGRRGGWRGWIDRVRERAEATLAFRGEASGADAGGTSAGRGEASSADAGGATGPGESGPRTALLRGMVLGQDHAFTDEQEETFRRSGLSHLVAASGQNVALVAALVIGLGALAGIRRPWRIAWAIAAVAVYVPLAGAGPSIRRAGVTGILTLLALGLGRPADRWWALLLAAIATVLADPSSPGQLGWQLSFAAVLGLLVLVDPLTAAAKRVGWPGWLGAAAAVPLGAGLATAPVLAAGVGDVSLTSLPANIVVEPVVAPLTWIGMVAGVLGPEGAPVSGWLVAATGPLLDWTTGVAVWAASPEWAVVRPAPATALAPVLALLAVLVVVRRPPWLVHAQDLGRRRLLRAPGGRRVLRVLRARRGPRGRAVAVCGAAAAAGAIAVGARAATAPVPVGPDGVVVLAVGQGSATLLRQGGRTILVDAGPADGRILDRLAEHGVRRLDALVLSHAAADHTGGAPAVAARLRPALLVDGRSGHDDPGTAVAAQLVTAAGGRVVPARTGLWVTAGALRAELRWPPPRTGPAPAGEDPNDQAAVLRATVGGVRVLLPSDREGAPLRRAAGGPVDLLVLPHHGSADPDVPRLLEAVSPRMAVAQVGAGNTYGHPAPETTDAVRAAGVPLRRTDRDGSVTVTAADPGPAEGTADRAARRPGALLVRTTGQGR